MSDIKINSEEELLRFLNLVAQESYSKAINESYLDFEEKYDFDKGRFGSLSAGSKKKLDEEEDEEPGLFDEPDNTQQTKNLQKDTEERPIDDEEEAMTTVSFDSVIDRINTLRAGRSTKDKQIKRSLEDYYNKLDDNERIVLKIFLEELSDILGGEIDGQSAKEPSDPPEKFKITSAEEDADAKVKADTDAIAPEKESDLPPEEQEDTTPPKEDLPVSVNEKKSDWELRLKIRELMER